MIRMIAATTRMPPIAIGSNGSSDPFLTFTGGRRPDVDFTLAPRTAALDRVWLTRLIEYRPNLSGLGRWQPPPIDTRPEPIGRRSPLRDYEVLYIVRADLEDDKVQDIVKRVNTLIEKAGGSVERTNVWGKRKLAYEVKHQKEGSYVLQDFQIGPDGLPQLEAALKITEEVLRHLIVRKPDKPTPAPAAPPPAEVVLEPVAVEASVAAERLDGAGVED